MQPVGSVVSTTDLSSLYNISAKYHYLAFIFKHTINVQSVNIFFFWDNVLRQLWKVHSTEMEEERIISTWITVTVIHNSCVSCILKHTYLWYSCTGFAKMGEYLTVMKLDRTMYSVSNRTILHYHLILWSHLLHKGKMQHWEAESRKGQPVQKSCSLIINVQKTFYNVTNPLYHM